MTTNSDNTNVANNVAQGNSQDLTKQWVYGKLKCGFYYIKDINDRVTTILYRQDHISVIKEILAPVPSYEEWQQLHKFLEEFNALDVAKENQQLKELLDKASYYLISYKNNDTLPERAFYEEEVSEFLDKIDEVLK